MLDLCAVVTAALLLVPPRPQQRAARAPALCLLLPPRQHQCDLRAGLAPRLGMPEDETLAAIPCGLPELLELWSRASNASHPPAISTFASQRLGAPTPLVRLLLCRHGGKISAREREAAALDEALLDAVAAHRRRAIGGDGVSTQSGVSLADLGTELGQSPVWVSRHLRALLPAERVPIRRRGRPAKHEQEVPPVDEQLRTEVVDTFKESGWSLPAAIGAAGGQRRLAVRILKDAELQHKALIRRSRRNTAGKLFPSGQSRLIPEQTLFAALRAAAGGEQVLSIASYRKFREASGGAKWPASQTFLARYGSWAKACTAAGLNSGRRWKRSNFGARSFADSQLYGYLGEYLSNAEERRERATMRGYELWSEAQPGVVARPHAQTIRKRLLCNTTWAELVEAERNKRDESQRAAAKR